MHSSAFRLVHVVPWSSLLIGLGYNTFLLHPRPITLAKWYLRFYSCHGSYTFDKTSMVFIFNICCFYTTSLALMLVSISYFTALIHDFQNGGRPPSWIFIFSQRLSKIQICAPRSQAKVGEDGTIRGRVIAYFRFLKNDGRPPSWIWYDVIADNSQLCSTVLTLS